MNYVELQVGMWVLWDPLAGFTGSCVGNPALVKNAGASNWNVKDVVLLKVNVSLRKCLSSNGLGGRYDFISRGFFFCLVTNACKVREICESIN